MFAKLVVVTAAVGFAAMLYAVESPGESYRALTYRTYRVDASGREVPLTEEHFELVRRDLSGRTHLLLTVRKLPEGNVLEKDVPVTLTRFGNLERRGSERWSPYRPRIVEGEYDTRIDYEVFLGREKTRAGRSFMLSFGLREDTYAGRTYRTLKVRSDIFEGGAPMVRHKCTFIFELRAVGSCREFGADADIVTRLEKVED